MSTARILVCFAFALVASACEKKPTTIGSNGSSGSGTGATIPLDTTPLQGVELGKLDADKTKLFYKLVDSMKSPCGKSESLRMSYAKDTSCKRAPFAVRYLVAFLEDEATEEQVRDYYIAKYESKDPPVKIDVSKAPRIGPADASVRLIEFFDYACQHCADFKPVLDEVAAANEGKVVEYFMMYPLGKWPHSKSAAQAGLAAHAQGKFKEMHATLFTKAPEHSEEAVKVLAAALGLDLKKFEVDYKAAAAQVDSDRAQGEAAKVDQTPWLIFNDRKYTGPLVPKYIGMWIEEEMAVNR